MKPRKGLKLRERFLSIETLETMHNITLFRYAGSLFGLWHIEGCFLQVDNFFIDTGNPNSSSGDFYQYLKRLDRQREWNILNTHLHEDHCGKNHLVQKVLKAKIFSPEEVEDFSFVSPLMDLVWGRPEMFTYRSIDRPIYTTDRGRNIEVIETPGHSPGHVSFRIMPDDIIYSGDAIPLPVRKRYVTAGEDYITEQESLKKLFRYAKGGTRFVSAHHGIVSDAAGLISERIRGMQEVIDSVNSHIALGLTSEAEIGLRVFGRPEVLYARFGNSLRCREDWTIRSILESPVS
ncbi:MAG: hypothetical protein CVV44_06970 [Spirochaetae bacterium HGW-Spirochaetae-1]|jgi:glyoxylase-like metal-dependent hydrolase (beta-lactamase superfamily II)|nr:MAG: hypothetical protein CVV44_06970 [Spirochaetae bacterium HGW-Spirochaetae-1]